MRVCVFLRNKGIFLNVGQIFFLSRFYFVKLQNICDNCSYSFIYFSVKITSSFFRVVVSSKTYYFFLNSSFFSFFLNKALVPR